MSEITSLGPVHSGLGAIRSLDYTSLLCNDIGAIWPFYTGIMGSRSTLTMPQTSGSGHANLLETPDRRRIAHRIREAAGIDKGDDSQPSPVSPSIP